MIFRGELPKTQAGALCQGILDMFDDFIALKGHRHATKVGIAGIV